MNGVALFKTPYKRPEKFSNPYIDKAKTAKEVSDETMQSIINTPDDKLKFHHFVDIYHFGLTAEYEEAAYFLPFALRYISLNSDGVRDCMSNVIWFISCYEDELKSRKLFEICREKIKECLEIWASEFEILGKPWFESINRSGLVSQFLDNLANYSNLKDLAFNFIKDLHTSENPIKIAWYLELCNDHYFQNEELKKLLMDSEKIKKCSNLIVESDFINKNSSPNHYWDNLFATLNIA